MCNARSGSSLYIEAAPPSVSYLSFLSSTYRLADLILSSLSCTTGKRYQSMHAFSLVLSTQLALCADLFGDVLIATISMLYVKEVVHREGMEVQGGKLQYLMLTAAAPNPVGWLCLDISDLVNALQCL